ncbi:MAG: hypothetical protein WCA00_14705 [Candidatus Acidiferrales bacterium]
MFCPSCKTEYRDGFTRCSDCGANLVARLKDAPVPSNRPAPADGPELLWTGIDAGLATHIESALDSAKISHHQRTRESGPLPGLSEPVYAIFIHARDHQAAHAALDDVIRRFASNPDEGDDEPDDSDASAAIPPDADDGDDASDVPQDYVPDDFDPAEATVEVWTGEDRAMRDNLVTFLGAIGIGSATDDSAGKLRIRVTPSSQKRALGMIRQVMDAS